MVNLAIELNGQPPLQVYVKPSKEYRITLRSIDLGAMEVVSTYEELQHFNKGGFAFLYSQGGTGTGRIPSGFLHGTVCFAGSTAESVRHGY